MVLVAEADLIIKKETRDYGTEVVPIVAAPGHVLAQDLIADRDLPPYDRATMDGIAIRYAAFEKGIRSFRIKATIAAGDDPVEIEKEEECLEIMTGAALPTGVDTVIRYEDLDIKNGIAKVVTDKVSRGQSIHYKGKDKRENEIVVTVNRFIDPAIISMAATLGKTQLLVKKLPRVVIISTGDELVPIDAQPLPYQIRQSNNHTISAILESYKIAADILHIPDDESITKRQIEKCLKQYDVILLSGGISMGKFDLLPKVLEELNVTKLFHKVQQRPGKPFWFGKDASGVLVFAFPGNPVSTFMCVYRYFLPWLQDSLGIPANPIYAILNADVIFTPDLQYFMQVKLAISKEGQLLATPIEGNGSGDFANLVDTDAFMELPLEQSNFSKGSVYRIWPFKSTINR